MITQEPISHNTIQHVLELVAKHAECDPATLDINQPIQSSGIDSLGVAELLFDLEDQYDVSIASSSDIQSRFDVGTVAELANYIEKSRSE